jgi:tRNA threonylcarbamoyl adenosine modification protein (Sua5/YciO/YrdC/YwlC family)
MAKKQIAEISLPVAAASLETIQGVANFSVLAKDLASAIWPGALTILTIPQDSLSWNIGQVDSALAVRVPHHETALAVLAGVGPCILTGAQQVGQGTIQTVEQAQNQLGELVDIYLDGGHLMGANSTVIDATTDNLRLIRAGAISLERIRQVLPGVIDASATN